MSVIEQIEALRIEHPDPDLAHWNDALDAVLEVLRKEAADEVSRIGIEQDALEGAERVW